jgi:ATP-dependent helicase HrpB
MATLLGEQVGQTVGYRVRFEARVSAETKIEVLTEGILTRMLQEDNALEGVAAVLFDEFHERNLQADVALALARECQNILRPDLKLLIMSATLDVAGLSSLLADSDVVRSAGKMFPVEVFYRPSALDIPIWGKVASACKEALKAQPSGDILAFLPGQREIERCLETLEVAGTEAVILPLYGDLTPDAQQKALLPIHGRRKIILSTSIAETSLTIEGVTVVIDSGLARVPKFDPRSGFTRLVTQAISIDSATQRAGRAGRLGPGICYRLWSETNHA